MFGWHHRGSQPSAGQKASGPQGARGRPAVEDDLESRALTDGRQSYAYGRARPEGSARGAGVEGAGDGLPRRRSS